MSNGLGAGFAALTLVAGLVLVGILAGLVALAGYALGRRRGEVPHLVTHLLVALGAVALAVSGFGVIAFADEAALVAWLLACLALLPLLLVAGLRSRTSDQSPATTFAATVAAWAPAFLVGLAVTVGATSVANAALGLPGAAQDTGVRVGTAALGGLVVVLGTAVLGRRLVALGAVRGGE